MFEPYAKFTRKTLMLFHYKITSTQQWIVYNMKTQITERGKESEHLILMKNLNQTKKIYHILQYMLG